MPPELIYDIREIDWNRVLVDQEGIRKLNPQRFEMEQLTAIVHIDQNAHIIAGYKDVGPDEFWIRGHMPDYPLMPGVIMCEAAAQLTSYYTVHAGLVEADFIAFGGMEDVRFRAPVKPGDRLCLIAKAIQVNRRRIHCRAQGFVKDVMVFQGDIMGVPFKK